MRALIDLAKRGLPASTRKTLRRAAARLRTGVAVRVGLLPDFLIIGAQKCGTTSLYDFLVEHPCVHPAATKEVGYFDRYYDRGLSWYRAQFPSRFQKYRVRSVRREVFVTGEASTGYILNPHALRRILQVVPNAKLILLLRNPIDRAFSHYHHTVRIGRETLSFSVAIEKEEERIGEAWARLLRDEHYYTIDIARYAYLRTGIYADQVKILFELFPREQVLIASTEDFAEEPGRVYGRVLRYLNLPDRRLVDRTWRNVGRHAEMDRTIRGRLESFFRPHNERLYEQVKVDFGWD